MLCQNPPKHEIGPDRPHRLRLLAAIRSATSRKFLTFYLYIFMIFLYILTMASYSITQFRSHLSEALEASALEAVFIQSHRKLQGVLISPERYEQLLEAYEELEDVRAIEESREDSSPNIPWDEIKREWGRTTIESFEIKLRNIDGEIETLKWHN